MCAALVLGLGAARAAENAIHWTYEGEEGPAHWGDVSPEYAVCSSGTMQSPVDLAGAGASGALAISLNYEPVPLTIFNNGHTIQLNAEGGGTFGENGVDYDLVQIHFHAPSEHVIAGEHFPLEAHFVHRSEGGALSVMGVFIAEGTGNPELAKLLQHLPESAGSPMTFSDTMVDLDGLLPASHALYRYMGSLTTPPCSEGVHWHVLSVPVTASAEQIARLSDVLHMNARPIQPLGSRLLVGPGR